MSNLKYMVIGAGGTGGAIGAHLAHAGHDVTFIARGKHLDAMKRGGLRVVRPDMEFTVEPVKAFDQYEYYNQDGAPDVIFVCVKGYSLDELYPFISVHSGPETIVIPILNIYGTGSVMQKRLPDLTVTDGCIYVASEIKEPGFIWMNGTILKVVFGLRRDQKEQAGLSEKWMPRFEQIRNDMIQSGIEGVISDNIERDALRKFSYVSPQGACGLYYNVPAGPMQTPGEIRDCFAGLVGEIAELASAMGLDFGDGVVRENLRILDELSPSFTTSLQRDVARGRNSEIDGLIYEVVRLGDKYGVEMPVYRMIVDDLKGLCL